MQLHGGLADQCAPEQAVHEAEIRQGQATQAQHILQANVLAGSKHAAQLAFSFISPHLQRYEL